MTWTTNRTKLQIWSNSDQLLIKTELQLHEQGCEKDDDYGTADNRDATEYKFMSKLLTIELHVEHLERFETVRLDTFLRQDVTSRAVLIAGARASFECKSPFNRTASDQINWGQDGIWNGPIPTCTNATSLELATGNKDNDQKALHLSPWPYVGGVCAILVLIAITMTTIAWISKRRQRLQMKTFRVSRSVSDEQL